MELTQFLKSYAESGTSRFHMPGHKGCPPAPDWAGSALSYDITEIQGADTLFQADGVLRRLEARIARFYGVSDSLLSAGGSTLCIQAMLTAAFREGDTVIAARNAHTAFVNACALLGLRPVWVYPMPLDSAGVSGAATPAQIADALRCHPEAKGVYLTSPDYLGVRSDIRAISDICHDRELPLLVDNAHGAALKLAGPGEHPMELGADLCCDSAHKTLPVLTGGAFLHLSGRYSRETLKAKMALFGSTSPSYLILASADRCLDWLEAEGQAAYRGTAAQISRMKALCRERGIPCIGGLCDPYRLSVRTGALGYSDRAAGQHFRAHRIEPEYIGGGYTVLMATPCNPPRDWERLEAALTALTPPTQTAVPSPHAHTAAGASHTDSAPLQHTAGLEAAGGSLYASNPGGSAIPHARTAAGASHTDSAPLQHTAGLEAAGGSLYASNPGSSAIPHARTAAGASPTDSTPLQHTAGLGADEPAFTPRETTLAEAVAFEPSEAVLTPREAVFALSETVSVGEATGRIAAETVISCPPGVPVVIPGEKITPAVENILKNSGIFALKVVK